MNASFNIGSTQAPPPPVTSFWHHQDSNLDLLRAIGDADHLATQTLTNVELRVKSRGMEV